MSFLAELKRSNVIRVGLANAVIGCALAQVASFAAETFGAPDWALKIFVLFLLLGLPLALFFARAFEMTPEGIKRDKDVDRSNPLRPGAEGGMQSTKISERVRSSRNWHVTTATRNTGAPMAFRRNVGRKSRTISSVTDVADTT